MEDIAEQLAIRDRFLKRISEHRTPEERMELMARLQRQARGLLTDNPEGYSNYTRRNMNKRAIDFAENHAA
ncbi:hypothetical protein [Humisphaera borealis]|uniref:Uncharacterized protein n=1 Tax=Humisphaera borealis TaxID=2807512 RepID=A0A7M2WY64_9BACT|nr:hypothetical protein [Humisphaera borealis]QOV90438.1 hypothetical protein IPV69_03465 [Humisphaera borealis]